MWYNVIINRVFYGGRKMEKERLFLVTKKIDKDVVILGYIKSNMYPSTIANDQEKAKEKFGYDYVTITEVPEKCFVKLCEYK